LNEKKRECVQQKNRRGYNDPIHATKREKQHQKGEDLQMHKKERGKKKLGKDLRKEA